MAVYDTKKIRNAAVLTRRLANSMTADVQPELLNAGDELEKFHGRTAEAMEDRLSQLEAENQSIVGELEMLTRQLNRYANLLEAADEQLARML